MLIYAVSSSGATLHIHYCCGKIDKIDFNSSKKEHCPFSDKAFQKSCCDNKQVELKIKNDYKVETEAKLPPRNITAYVNSVHAVFDTSLFISSNPLYFSGVSPPLSAPVPLYILDCVYRI